MDISRATRRACVVGAAAFVAFAGCSFPDHQFLPIDQFNQLKDGGASGGSAGVGGTGGSGGLAGSGGIGGVDAGGSGGVAGTGGTSGAGGTGGSGGTSGVGGVDGGGTGGTSGAGGTAGTAGTGGTAGSDAGTCTGHVVINEVSTDGTSGSDEFVELYNASSCAVDLAGWRLDYTSSSGSTTKTNWTGVSGDSLPVGGYFVVAGLGFGGTADYVWGSGFGLAKGGAGVALYDPAGASPIDSMAWQSISGTHPDIEGTACANIPSGKSASRTPNGKDTDDNSADFVVGAPRTPGKPN